MKNLFFTIAILVYFLCQINAQSDGYFGVWENKKTTQEFRFADSFNEWVEFDHEFKEQGLVAVEFEEFFDGGYSNFSRKYFGVWEDKGEVEGWWYWSQSFDEWLAKTEEVEALGVKLVDFETFEDLYLGLYYWGWEKQEVATATTFEEWLQLHQTYSNQGFRLIDFDKHNLNGEFFIGVWEEGAANQVIEMADNLLGWQTLQIKYNKENKKLIDFEQFFFDGKSRFVGIWETATINQEIVVANNQASWENFNQKYTAADYKLVDFKVMDDGNIFEILPNQKIIRDEDLTIGNTYNWSKDTIYILEGIVQLESEGRLFIEAGTEIIARDSAALVIAEAAQLFANGTKENPIVFSAQSLPVWEEAFHRGIWKGLKITGLDNFSSGNLSYVSIKNAGQNGAGLELKQVNDLTILNYVDIFASGGDGISIHGGDANLAYISITHADGNAFEWDLGWIGNGIYWFAAYIDGIMMDGKGNTQNPNGILSAPQIYNGTFVGPSCTPYLSPNAQLRFTASSGGLLANCLFTDFPDKAISIENKEGESDTYQRFIEGNLAFKNNIWWNVGEDKVLLGESGTIDIANLPSQEIEGVVNQLRADENIIEGPGIAANTSWAPCYALDPRLHPTNNYARFLNTAYPTLSFFDIKPTINLKGAFLDDNLWVEDWTGVAGNQIVGDAARSNFVYRGIELLPIDTLTVSCEELAELQDSLGYSIGCLPIIIQMGASSRMGNKRRRPSGRSNQNDIAFIEEWNYLPELGGGCHLTPSLNLTVLVIDTIAPIIHPIPDKNGQLSVFLEDCDEANLTNITRDTQGIEGTLNYCVIHTFYAEDYSGNQSTLEIKEVLDDSITLYADLDGDGFGNPNLPFISGSPIDGFVDNNLDCNDEDANAFPGSNLPEEDGSPLVDEFCIGEANFDICNGAKLLHLTPISEIKSIRDDTFWRANASLFPFLPDGCGFPSNYRDLWFQAIVPASGAVTLYLKDESVTGFAHTFGVEAFTGDCSNLEFIDCKSQETFLSFPVSDLTPGTSIFFRVVELGNVNGFLFKASMHNNAEKTKNDFCELATSLEISNDENCITEVYNNINALEVVGYDSIRYLCHKNIKKSIWFEYTVLNENPFDIEITTINNSQFINPIIQVLEGSCGDFESIACSRDSENSTNKLTLSNRTAGEKLFINITEVGEAEGEFELSICHQSATITSIQHYEPKIVFEIIPNPSSSQQPLELSINMPNHQVGIINLYNLQGKILRQLSPKSLFSEGLQNLEINISDIPTGMYFIQLDMEEGIITKKLIITN